MNVIREEPWIRSFYIYFNFQLSHQHKLPVALMYFKISHLNSSKGEYRNSLVQQCEFNTDINIYLQRGFNNFVSSVQNYLRLFLLHHSLTQFLTTCLIKFISRSVYSQNEMKCENGICFRWYVQQLIRLKVAL